MVNNYERIFEEIKSEAERLATENDIDSNALISLAMEIVDLEESEPHEEHPHQAAHRREDHFRCGSPSTE